MPSTMHSNSRPLIGSLAVKTLSVAVASMALFSSAYAAGLGKLTVLSSLGQPLRAEIELTSISADEQGALVAKLASAEAFGQANIEFNPALLSLRFAIEQRGQRQFIRLTSSQPLNEPFVDMLMELTGPNGRLIREYTFLLDPAEMRPAQPVQVAPSSVPAPDVARAQQAPVSEPRSNTQNSVARATNAPSRPSLAQASDYTVQKGDTLSRIAERTKPDNVSLDQMLVALYQANPEAFIDRNMNRLKAGEILSVPDAETTARVSNAEARTLIVAQAADFNAYRSKLAAQVGAAAPQQSNEARQSASGKITTQVEERPTPASAAKDKLTLSSPAAAKNNPANTVPAEDLIAREKALAEANARVQELEKNISELQKLLEVKNQGLAEQQNQAEAPKAEVPAATPAAPAAPVEPVPAEASKAETAPAAPPVVAKPKPAPAAAPAVAAESSFMDELLANPLTLPGIGALLVVLGGLGIYRARRQKRSKQFEDSIITDSSLKANSLFGSTGGQSVDTNNSVFNSGFATSANQLDSNEVDPVAEADVYIAYGRDAQAEEILKEAMRTQPERHAVRVKLLEIYSNRKDLRAFEVLATELYGLTRGEGDEWAQAAAMGMAIDPQNPLYAGAKSGSGNSVGASALNVPTQPLDEQGLATLLSATQSDTSEMTGMGALETDTSYFSNTGLTEEKPSNPVQEPEPDPEMILDDSSNEMDFNLDEMSNDLAVPNTMPRPESVEPSAELASIDFDFLDVPKSTDEPAVDNAVSEPALEPVADQQPAMEFTLDDTPPAEAASPELAPMDFGIPEVPTADPAVETSGSVTDGAQSQAADEPMDFDLSGISLELDPAASAASPELSTEGLDAGSFSSSAEMATKLDLAIAYQEIGDKEGARELLDEVLKGGSPEQSEKAKNLLLELA